jgi:hypothetical protein
MQKYAARDARICYELMHAVDAADKRGLAAARGAHEGCYAVVLHGQINVFEHGVFTETG